MMSVKVRLSLVGGQTVTRATTSMRALKGCRMELATSLSMLGGLASETLLGPTLFRRASASVSVSPADL